jgi:hypothetical protein
MLPARQPYGVDNRDMRSESETKAKGETGGKHKKSRRLRRGE